MFKLYIRARRKLLVRKVASATSVPDWVEVASCASHDRYEDIRDGLLDEVFGFLIGYCDFTSLSKTDLYTLCWVVSSRYVTSQLSEHKLRAKLAQKILHALASDDSWYSMMYRIATTKTNSRSNV